MRPGRGCERLPLPAAPRWPRPPDRRHPTPAPGRPGTGTTGTGTTGVSASTPIETGPRSWSTVRDGRVIQYTFDPVGGRTVEQHERGDGVETNTYTADGRLTRSFQQPDGDVVEVRVTPEETRRVVKDPEGKVKDREVTTGRTVQAPTAPVTATPDAAPQQWVEADARCVQIRYQHDPTTNTTVSQQTNPDGGRLTLHT